MQDFLGKGTSSMAFREWRRLKGYTTSSVAGLVQDVMDTARPWVLCQCLEQPRLRSQSRQDPVGDKQLASLGTVLPLLHPSRTCPRHILVERHCHSRNLRVHIMGTGTDIILQLSLASQACRVSHLTYLHPQASPILDRNLRT